MNTAVAERLTGAEIWEALIPEMGLFALIRNLRGFDEAGVSNETAALVAARMSDPAEVERSRILPMRLLAAYQNAPNVRWHAPLEAALQHSLANIPSLDGNTLILVDRSGSMFSRMSQRSELTRADSAAIFGSALALRANKATLVEFGSTWGEVRAPKGGSVLPMLSKFHNLGGTDTVGALKAHLTGKHTRVVILTDEQDGGGYYSYYGHRESVGDVVPTDVPLHTVNLVGYRVGHKADGHNRFTYGGLSDSSWALLELTEKGANGVWPWANRVS